MPKLPKVLVLVLLMAGAANLSGCALSAATIVPAAVGGAPVVIDSLEADSSDTFWLAAVRCGFAEAALRARAVLALKLEDAEIDDDKAVLKFTDQQSDRITLHIERRTETVTRVRFVSGSSDIRGLTRLLGRQIIEELRLDGAFLVDWASEEGNVQP